MDDQEKNQAISLSIEPLPYGPDNDVFEEGTHSPEGCWQMHDTGDMLVWWPVKWHLLEDESAMLLERILVLETEDSKHGHQGHKARFEVRFSGNEVELYRWYWDPDYDENRGRWRGRFVDSWAGDRKTAIRDAYFALIAA